MIKFAKLQENHLQMILEWRVKPEIAQFMLTTVDYDLEKQMKWFKTISNDPTVAYWIIEYQKVPVGLINLAAIDRISRKCNAGFYVGEMQHRQLSAFILPYFYNFAFKELGFHKIYGEVVDGNNAILHIHALHGYRLVGTYKDHIFRDGRYLDLHIVELMANTWLEQKRYHRYIAEFEV